MTMLFGSSSHSLWEDQRMYRSTQKKEDGVLLLPSQAKATSSTLDNGHKLGSSLDSHSRAIFLSGQYFVYQYVSSYMCVHVYIAYTLPQNYAIP